MSTASLMGQIMGGGRLYRDAPLAGYTEEEMVAEAKQRMGHNRQRRRLKQLLSAASNDGSTVATKDLLLAAKLAKMDLPEAMIADTPYATGVDGVGARPARANPVGGAGLCLTAPPPRPPCLAAALPRRPPRPACMHRLGFACAVFCQFVLPHDG